MIGRNDKVDDDYDDDMNNFTTISQSQTLVAMQLLLEYDTICINIGSVTSNQFINDCHGKILNEYRDKPGMT